MTPARTKGSSWSYRLEIDWTTALGFRIDRVSETQSLREHNALVALLWQLRNNGQVDVLRAFARGQISVAQLKQAKHAGRLQSDALMADLALYEPLWHRAEACPRRADPNAKHDARCEGAIDRLLPSLGKSAPTRKRYYVSFKKLREVAGPWLPANATVRDLEQVKWREVRARWTVSIRRRKVPGRGAAARAAGYVVETKPASAADWNHLIRALSTFLTALLGDVYHPMRRQIIKHLEREREVPRQPRIKDVFWQIVDLVPEHARPCYVVFAASGMRLGEYLYADLVVRPEDFSIETKGKTGAHIYKVDPEYWPWVQIGVPSPLREGWMRKYFKRAVKELGRPDLRLHDLRHLFAQMAKSEGAHTTDTMDALGQRTPGIARMYETDDAKAEVAAAAARGLTKRRMG